MSISECYVVYVSGGSVYQVLNSGDLSTSVITNCILNMTQMKYFYHMAVMETSIEFCLIGVESNEFRISEIILMAA